MLHGVRRRDRSGSSKVAEELQAIVALGQANTRMKGFYDLLTLSRLFELEDQTLTTVIRATFEGRGTTISRDTPVGLSDAVAGTEDKQRQWVTLNKRELLSMATPDLPEAIEQLRVFPCPLIASASLGSSSGRRWSAGGPWGC